MGLDHLSELTTKRKNLLSLTPDRYLRYLTQVSYLGMDRLQMGLMLNSQSIPYQTGGESDETLLGHYLGMSDQRFSMIERI